MHTEVEIAAEIHRNRLLIPQLAVLVRGGRKLAFVVENGLAKWRYIEVGLENEDYTEFVHSPYYPKVCLICYCSIYSFFFTQEKEEYYWILIGDSKANKLYAIKRITFKEKTKVDLGFIAPDAGVHNLSLFIVCDSFVGCDHVNLYFYLKIFNDLIQN